MNKKQILTIIVIALLLTAGACASRPEDSLQSESDTNDSAAMIGTTWLWERFDDTADINNIVIADPTQYTFRLNADGTYTVKADCNQASGSYIMDGSSLSFEEGPTTLAECAPESHYHKFLTSLSHVATFVREGDTLYLNLWADGGNMVFVPAAE